MKSVLWALAALTLLGGVVIISGLEGAGADWTVAILVMTVAQASVFAGLAEILGRIESVVVALRPPVEAEVEEFTPAADPTAPWECLCGTENPPGYACSVCNRAAPAVAQSG